VPGRSWASDWLPLSASPFTVTVAHALPSPNPYMLTRPSCSNPINGGRISPARMMRMISETVPPSGWVIFCRVRGRSTASV
jgi:hypothetical protein